MKTVLKMVKLYSFTEVLMRLINVTGKNGKVR